MWWEGGEGRGVLTLGVPIELTVPKLSYPMGAKKEFEGDYVPHMFHPVWLLQPRALICLVGSSPAARGLYGIIRYPRQRQDTVKPTEWLLVDRTE